MAITQDPPKLRQSTYNAACRWQSRSVSATFSQKTLPGSLIILFAVMAGGWSTSVKVPAGFKEVRTRSVGYLQVSVWYYEGAPSMSGATVTIGSDRSLQLRLMEYTGAAGQGALDQVSVLTNSHDRCDTGDSGITKQSDEVIVSCIANRHASCTQSGFIGGLARLFENVSPQYYGRSGYNQDDERSRCTIHEIGWNFDPRSWRHQCRLSAWRDWIAIIMTFRGGSFGPKKFTSTTADPISRTSGGTARLTAFGRLKSTAQPAISVGGAHSTALILPFNYQYRLNGLLVGDGTPYDVTSHDGLYGYTVRTSDNDQPRGDGAQRGVDLQSAREVVFNIEVGGTQFEVEQLLEVLYRALTPQRDVDWDLVWRHPSQGARQMRVRPIELPRTLAYDTTRLAVQKVGIRAADPRHYAATKKTVVIPATPANASQPLAVSAVNVGDIPAYPMITIVGPVNGPTLNRVQLVNSTSLVTFDVQLTIPPRSVLVGDMPARVTGAPRSVITLDGQTKYGAWNLPRQPFRIDPAPYAIEGENSIYLVTDPPGAPVVAQLEYRDTWAG